MDDISNMISGLLESPEGLDKIKSLAGLLLAGDENKTKKGENTTSSETPSGLDTSMLLKVKNLMSKINTKDDKRVNLLMALRPYLSHKRIENMDNAIKLLKFSQIALVLGDDFKF